MGTYVVGVDGSAESVEALRWAVATAGAENPIHVVTAWTYPVAVGTEVGYGGGVTAAIPYEEIESAARASLEDALGQVDTMGVDLTHEVVMSLSPSAALVAAATDADLLVVGTRPHSTLDRVFLGSVAIQCAHHATCAFVAVPDSPPPIGSGIAVAVDGSEASQAALRWAAGVATERDVRLRVISAWERVGWSSGPRLVDPDRSDDERALDQLKASVEEIVPDIAARAEYRSVHAEHHVASHLVEAADGAGMLVLGSRGHGGFAGLLLGSVSQRCLEASTIPVAIIRS